jgi:hypothetical protein
MPEVRDVGESFCHSSDRRGDRFLPFFLLFCSFDNHHPREADVKGFTLALWVGGVRNGLNPDMSAVVLLSGY